MSDELKLNKESESQQELKFNENEFICQLTVFKSKGANFKDWSAVKTFKDKVIQKKNQKAKLVFVSLFLVVIVGIIAHMFNENLKEDDECLLPNPEFIQDIFRPLQSDCEFCKIDSIHMRSNLSEEEFYQKYAFTGLPVLIEDGMRDWTTEKFGFQYFKSLYTKYKDDYEEAQNDPDNKCQFFGYKSKFGSLEEVLNMPEDRANFKPGTEPWYIGWANCVNEITRILRKDYNVPYFIGRSESTNQDWMFMGSAGYKGAPLHIDFVDFNSWQAQIKGHKKWKMVPPPECWEECPNREHTIVVKPGNVFVFDSNRWFHSTEVLPGEYSLTIGAEYD